MDTKKMKEIFEDQAFVKSLIEKETAAQVQAELKKKGIDLTEQDVMKLREEINSQINSGKSADELSLNALDDVAGGVSVNPILSIVKNPVIDMMKKMQQPGINPLDVRW